MKFTVDFTELQEADDGNTTYFGGLVKVNGVVLQASGDDRSGGIAHVVGPEIERQLGRQLSEEEEDVNGHILAGSYLSENKIEEFELKEVSHEL